MEQGRGFDVLVVTARREKDAVAYQQELQRWQREERLSFATVVLAAPDPAEGGAAAVGSGGQVSADTRAM